MPDVQILVGLLVAIALLAAVAHRLELPFPVVLVLGGLAAGLLPGLPELRLEPEAVFVVFLPPLVFSAAFVASPRELRADATLIGLLAVGLVLATIVAVAAGTRWALGVPWPAAFVLGAILGPTDPIAATTVLRRLGAPPRVAAILEGEALINDGTALTAYKLALAAMAASTLSWPSAVAQFVAIAAGGVAFGVAIAWLVGRLRRHVDAAEVELPLSLLTPYVAYIPADQLGLSGLLAAVAAGLYAGRQAAELSSSDTRLRTYAFWEALVFLLNSLLFLLIGLQLPAIVDALAAAAPTRLLADATLVAALVVGVRFAWLFTLARGVDALAYRRGTTDSVLAPAELLVLGWSGMRGAVSLAAALALPLTEHAGLPLPDRDRLLFLTYAVVLVTLVVPGLTLPAMLRRFGLEQTETRRRLEAEARAALAHVALEHVEALAAHDGLSEEASARLRGIYEARLDAIAERFQHNGQPLASRERRDRLGIGRARRDVIRAQRQALTRLHDEGKLPADLRRQLARELDLEEATL
jgi:CPA1 family monovalent cation:H+ antiporter